MRITKTERVLPALSVTKISIVAPVASPSAKSAPESPRQANTFPPDSVTLSQANVVR